MKYFINPKRRFPGLDKSDTQEYVRDDGCGKVPSEMEKLREENRQLQTELSRLRREIKNLAFHLRQTRQRSKL